MTCFWDGLLRNLYPEDLILLNSNKNINNIDFILLLKKNNKLCENVIWQKEKLSKKILEENYEMVKIFNVNNINQGYECGTCDPFMILLCELLKININHDYNGHNIQYNINDARKTINYKSNQSHFF